MSLYDTARFRVNTRILQRPTALISKVKECHKSDRKKLDIMIYQGSYVAAQLT